MVSNKEMRADVEEQLRQIDIQITQIRQEAWNQITAMIDEYGFSSEELGLSKKQTIKSKKDPKKKALSAQLPRRTIPPLYRDPESGKTWTGRGNRPRWMHGERENYLIKKIA